MATDRAQDAGRAFVRNIGPIIVVALLILAALQAKRADENADILRDVVAGQRDAQVQGCIRGNKLRAQVTANVQVIDEFLKTAARARREEGNRTVAEQYEELRGHLDPLEPVDCDTAYPEVQRAALAEMAAR